LTFWRYTNQIIIIIIYSYSLSTGYWLRFYIPLNKTGHFGDVPQTSAWLGMEKQNLTQQKLTFNNQKKCTATQNKHTKLKPGLVASYEIQPGNGVDLFWFQRLMNLSLTYLLTALDHTGLSVNS